MKISICYSEIDLDRVTPISNEVGVSYSFMDGKSPFFKSVQELMDYYNHCKLKIKHWAIIPNNKGKDAPFLFIYEHLIAICEHTTNSGYNANKGEVLSTDEYYIYSIKAKAWNGKEGFDL